MWLTGLVVPRAELSPKFHEYEYGPVPPETVAVKLAGLPATGVVGVKVKAAVRACGATVTLWDEFAVFPLLSVTVTVTVYVPLVL